MAMATKAFGVDIGGTGIKGAPVNLRTGALLAERLRILTPSPSTPEAVAEVVVDVVKHFEWSGPVGVTFPAVVQHGVVRTAANIHESWIDFDADALFDERLGLATHMVNDGDAAGVAEARFGAARDTKGLVIVTTLGTGIGSALILDGKLIPNTELGHLEIKGEDAEKRASEVARIRENLSWTDWAKRLTRYYRHLEDLFWPDLFVVGGGGSKKADRWLPLVKIRTPIVPAALLNDAGIVGAALLAAEQYAVGTTSPARARKA